MNIEQLRERFEKSRKIPKQIIYDAKRNRYIVDIRSPSSELLAADAVFISTLFGAWQTCVENNQCVIKLPSWVNDMEPEDIYELCECIKAAGAKPDLPDEECQHCAGSGDVHRADGEYIGICTCPAGIALGLSVKP